MTRYDEPFRSAPRPPASTITVLVAFGVAFISALPYLLGEVSRTFVNLDDPEYVYQNTHVLEGLTAAGVRWALSNFSAANWHPLTWVSHMLDVSLFGTNPFGHHLMSIGLHALTAAVLFLALRRMTGALWASACVAALFGCHPQHVESVAWVAERKDVLSGLCFALTLLAYERYARRGGAARYLVVFALLALGLMAKPMLVTAPFVLLLVDLWPLGRTRLEPPADRSAWAPRSWGRLVAEKVPLLALSAASSVVTFRAQAAYEAIAAPGALPVGTRIANAFVSIATYLGKTFWPTSLAVYYPYPQAGYPGWQSGAAALMVLAVTAAVLVHLRRRAYLAVGWFWFLGMLVPVLGFIQVGLQAMADRYTYLPHVGLFILGAWGLPGMLTPLPWARRVPAGAAICAVALLALASARQASYWRDGETLFSRTLAVTAGNWMIHTNLGVLLADQGRYAEAEANYRAAIAIRPGYEAAHNNLGVVLVKMGRPGEAITHYRDALRLRPDKIDVRYNLARALAGTGRRDEALLLYREVLRGRPESEEVRFNLGNVLVGLGRLDEAIAHYREALRLNPGLTDARLNLGNALSEKGRLEEALVAYRELLRLTPDSPIAHNNLANVLARMRRFEEAVAHYREALRLRPEQMEIARGLEAALEGLRRSVAAGGGRRETP